jgi:hypothetical protein
MYTHSVHCSLYMMHWAERFSRPCIDPHNHDNNCHILALSPTPAPRFSLASLVCTATCSDLSAAASAPR